MKPLVLLFWILALPVHTFVLQPSLNVSVLQNVSAEGDLWAEQRFDQKQKVSLNIDEDGRRNEEEITFQVGKEKTDTIYSNRVGELKHEMKKTEREEETPARTGSDNKKQEADKNKEQREEIPDEHDTSEIIQEHNEMEQIATERPYSSWNTTHPQAVIREKLPPTEQTVNQYTTPPVLHLLTVSVHKQTTLPPPPSTSQRPVAIAEDTPMNSTLLFKTTAATTKPAISQASPEPAGAVLLVNGSSTNDDLIAELHVANSSVLHPLEVEGSVSTAMAARAGPTATAQPPVVLAKLKTKVAGAKIKANTALKTKKKTKDRGRKKTKDLKKGKKVKRLKHEMKLKPTTASYFPYFKDDYCPSECSCYGRVVQCSDKNLDKIPFGIPFNSRYVLLMNNQIDSIQLNLLSEYDSMEFMVLTNNRLMDASIEGAFEGIQGLKRLYMERNLLRSIPTDLPATLEELRLDGNQVSVISEAALSRCPGLLILSLSNNSLGNGSSTIPAGVFRPLGNLRTLVLSHNQLTSVPLQLPLCLRELYLRGNRIQRFQDEMFWGKADLQVLDLSANKLTDKGLGKEALLNTSRLESLNLEGNLLKQIPRHLPPSIKTLNLESNFISSISKDAFVSMPQLEHLGLARNKITKVALGALRVLPLLHQLDLSHNALQQVPRQLPLWLHYVTFTHNKIRMVPRDAFCWGPGNKSPLSRLVRVQLEHNMIDLAHLDTQAYRCLRGFQVVQFY